METSFVLQGETPSKKNVNKFNTKTKCMYKDRNFQEWHDFQFLYIAGLKARKMIKCFPEGSVVRIYMNFVHGDYHRRDSDNQCSSILDLLVDSKIIVDDKWQIVRRKVIDDNYEKNNARCEIKIETF